MHATALRPTSRDTALVESVKAYALNPSFPCLGARSAINSQRAHFASYGQVGRDDPVQLKALCEALAAFSDVYPNPGEAPVTYIALFDNDVRDEEEFERRLWRHLQLLHCSDRRKFDWAPRVSSDAQSCNFSFSIAGRAFFVVGLHPYASRIARRSPVPCLVFNFHNQFEQLKASGKYEKLQRSIRIRDIALQGNINPVLARFGEASEARQYSGRAVSAGWQCPFRSGARDAS